MNFQFNKKNKRLLFIIGIVILIELSGYGFFAASLFRLIGSVS
tara:strand:- start:302 stop:430 length:129 start_codon:yes stop_codon:yes gene_type:complete